ncbi:ATP-binding protein [Paucibacter sp. B2R-40]|uniref:ATP-binding protein n=1 Tax=Paucibacter sp. B2R-40 TaxID=2893554 RepID=UPI0021E3F9B0|nr:ATP-binding protein [Paucibacter sp. B2R-40]MCV2355356.1 ATP-binding protein [Paucibacter sp. B2R-40]
MQNQTTPSNSFNQTTCSKTARQPNHPVKTELVLIRGLPGSGKSTMASVLTLVGYEHYEADMFFMRDGVYHYDATRIRDAHAWCQKLTREALSSGRRVVVSNTFTMLREIEPYRSMTSNLRIVEALGKWENSHDVPTEMVQRMAERWEVLATH